MKPFLFVLLGCLVLGLTWFDSSQAQKNQPNIVLVIADDFGIDASPCYALGQLKPKMPNLERLCQAGVVFENVWVNPTCTPTRATFLTGKYGFRTQVRAVDEVLSTSEISLQRELSTIGYSSAVIGKWHLAGAKPDPTHPQQMGVGFYSGFMTGGVRDYFSWSGIEQGRAFQSDQYITTALTDKAIAWVGLQKQPFFLWLAYNAPHSPFHLPPTELVKTTLSGRAADVRRDPQPYYFAMLEALDLEFGRLYRNLPANTVVLFVGDNGTPAQVVQEPYSRRTSKGTVAQGGVHVPLVVAGVGVQAKRESALVNGTDVFATIAQIAGASSKSAVDSLSFAPALNGAFVGRSHLYTEAKPNLQDDETARGFPALAIRDVRYKLVRNLEDGTEALFDVFTDPAESQNLLEQMPAQAAQLRTKLEELYISKSSAGVLW
jgi:arylsulfatase A-like enzyme